MSVSVEVDVAASNRDVRRPVARAACSHPKQEIRVSRLVRELLDVGQNLEGIKRLGHFVELSVAKLEHDDVVVVVLGLPRSDPMRRGLDDHSVLLSGHAVDVKAKLVERAQEAFEERLGAGL